MFKRLYEWFISLFKKESGLPAEKEEKTKPLKLDLQFFAEPEDLEDPEDPDDPEDPEDLEDDIPDLDELLKDKKFKKQYQAKLKEQLGKRMKKYEGIDPEEYRRLKEKAEKKKDDAGDEDELETLKSELTEKEKRIERAERREKRAMVKEFAVDNQVNPKLLARLINVDDIELDDDGEPENLEELFEELEEEFPEYFGASDDEEEEDEPERKKKTTFVPGPRQKSNKKKKVDPYEAGRLKALERHKKEED
ncbi:phage scaffolding protein [Oceanobacillus caeni]|uniref:phage scaffolding protein n=1 Tax=Oceanobacillus caeni TaxID=405946 RepID=UPI00362BDB06